MRRTMRYSRYNMGMCLGRPRGMPTTILGQKSSATTFSDISYSMKKTCQIKLKVYMCSSGCQLNTVDR